jgi:hypothetical protein
MPTVPDALKTEINDKAAALIETVLAPTHLYPRPPDWRWSYPIELYTRWWHHYLYFCATYFTPHPEAVPPRREVRFARLEYCGNKRFNLAFMRHTGEWVVVYENRSLAGCLRAMRDEEIFQP